ncbi:uncharacterized protein LOC106061123 [Biomphalaria glabrata]|uniref:Uncharacterized protein LOC106061123 n=1 Tax=Biomphalaria glabrata TaxID=6526 RepID=A0A9W2ZBA2_BIOGL|nr:uncharacterized protein LOC106061123 [Biomphalaria glabrata]
MFSKSYFSTQSRRRVLTPEEEALIPLQFNTHCGFVKQSLSQKTLGNVHSVSFSRGNGAPLSVDTSIPFPDFLRKLSESLRRTKKQNGVKSEALGSSPCVELQQTEPDSSCPEELVRTKSEVLNGHDVFKDSLEISNSERIKINGLEKGECEKPDNNAFKHSGIYSIRDILGKHSTSQRGSQADTGCYQSDISSLPIGLPPAPECTFYGHSATRYKQMFQHQNYLGQCSVGRHISYHDYTSGLIRCRQREEMEFEPQLAGVRFSQDYVHWPHLLPGQAILPPWTQDRRPAGAGCDM